MPPAFNLSQDQTLQFDLDLLSGIEVNFTSNIRERLRSLDLTDTFLCLSGTRLQTPTLIGCMFLKNSTGKLHLPAPTVGWREPIFQLSIETVSSDLRFSVHFAISRFPAAP